MSHDNVSPCIADFPRIGIAIQTSIYSSVDTCVVTLDVDDKSQRMWLTRDACTIISFNDLSPDKIHQLRVSYLEPYVNCAWLLTNLT